MFAVVVVAVVVMVAVVAVVVIVVIVVIVAIVVGGTGVAPALQILRELVDDSDDGAFAGIDCSATLLYSSRTALDVLCIDVRTVQVMYAARFTFMAFQSNANECAADFNLPRDQSRAAIDFGKLRMTVLNSCTYVCTGTP